MIPITVNIRFIRCISIFSMHSYIGIVYWHRILESYNSYNFRTHIAPTTHDSD